MNQYQLYLKALRSPFKKIAKLEFLNPDDSVAFAVGNSYRRGYNRGHDTRAFLQSGSLNVSLQNGQRRKANVTLSDLDDAFHYSVNRLWYGNRLRLQMGIVLPDGTDFYLPQGVFYLSDPKATNQPGKHEITYQLLDKWSYLDGTLFGKLPYSYQINANSFIFQNMRSVLQLSRQNMTQITTDPFMMLDSSPPVFTDYYNSLPSITYEYELPNGTKETMQIPPTKTAFATTVQMGDTAASILLDLNRNIVGWIGYDQNGTLRVEPSQDDILDISKPTLWTFSQKEVNFLGEGTAYLDKDVYNDVIVAGQGLDDSPVFGRATNYDPSSDTNVNLIGLKTYKEERADYWNASQCISLADFILKRKCILRKSISIECTQMFHLMENRLIAIQRPDKEGAPLERHLIQSFSIPIGEVGSMTINATSVNDISITTTTSSMSTS